MEKQLSDLGLGGLLGGLGSLIDSIGDLAEKGKELRQSGEFGGPEGKVRGMYGFNVKVGIGGEGEKGVKIEPFGNVHQDKETGTISVDEVREPMVDIFDEDEHVLVIAEMPGANEEDITLDLQGDILTVSAEKGKMKYRKELLLPQSFAKEAMSCTCRSGILEIKLIKSEPKSESETKTE
ncbi:MAG: Hsp20/alpha crystallin family protein [Planctomycetes bacterium]|nr:Hsp20/alpha crystallin family protein [Planctomycetota bacterium]